MRKRICVGLICWCAVVAHAKPAIDLSRKTPVPATAPVPVADFFRPYLLRGATLNNDGTLVAAHVSSDEDRADLMVINLKSKTADRLVAPRNLDVGGYTWLDATHLVFSTIREKRYSSGLHFADTHDLLHATPINAFDVVRVIAVPHLNPLSPIVWIQHSAAREGGDGGVVQFDTSKRVQFSVETTLEGYGRIVSDQQNTSFVCSSPGPGHAIWYCADRDGALAFAITVNDGVGRLQRWDGKVWTPSDLDLDKYSPVAAGEKAGEILVLGAQTPGKPEALQRFDAITGKLGAVVWQDSDYDCVPVHFHWRDSDRRLLGIDVVRDGPRTVWFDDAYKEIQAKLAQLLPGRVPRIADMDATGKKLLVRTMSDRCPGQYYLYNAENDEIVSIGAEAPWIEAERMRPRQLIKYKASDGVTIEGYATFPAGTSKEHPAPLVVLPHGGPWVRDSWGWDDESQFFASRGYAVFQPNYRGSLGYGWRYPDEQRWDFRRMSDDVTDGTRALVKTGLVDPHRIAIMGSSFGAYLALCGVTDEPDLYRCAIGVAGVYDWETVLHEAKGDDYVPTRYGTIRRHLGDPKLNAATYESISPLRRADRIKVPVFVAHGRDDRIASVDESKRLIRQLQEHHVPCEVMLQNAEGHGFARLENQVALYSDLETFLAKNMTVQTQPATRETAESGPMR